MTNRGSERVCVVPQVSGVGGMVSFRGKLVSGLSARGIQICYDLDDRPYRAALVIGGTRQLGKLRRARREGARIVQRLDGMNWIHRRIKTGARHYLRAEYGNWLLGVIRARLADRIVYQSEFARGWWEGSAGSVMKPSQVIYNGVDLQVFKPQGKGEPPPGRLRILVVEGSLMGGYEVGLEHAFRLAAGLARHPEFAHSRNNQVEIQIIGRVPEHTQRRWEAWVAGQAGQKVGVHWVGLVPHSDIPAIDRSAHLLFSADLNAACPNSVIEALACGTPVLGYDTGALPEMVPPTAGRVAPFGGNSWKLDPPDLEALVHAGLELLHERETLRLGARQHAVDHFDVDDMVTNYQQVLLGD